MSPPETRNGRPAQAPVIAEIAATARKQDPREGTALRSLVTITTSAFSSRVTGLDAHGVRVLRRAATASGCERDGSDWIVYSSRLARVVAALEKAGFSLKTTSTPAARPARTS